MVNTIRTRWAAIGAAVAVTLGAGGIALTHAADPTNGGPVLINLLAPCRVVDTRADYQIGPKGTPIGAGEANAYEITVTGGQGECTGVLAVPTDATAVALNVTAINNSTQSHFRIYPGDTNAPNASSLNFGVGQTPLANTVDVALSSSGTIKIYNQNGTADAAVDIIGYYTNHNHDDRYYTETEVDTAIAASTPMFAHVTSGSSASVTRGSGATGVTYWATGIYGVTFNKDISACGYSGVTGKAAAGAPLNGSTISLTPSAGDEHDLYVRVSGPDGSLIDEDFYVIVVC